MLKYNFLSISLAFLPLYTLAEINIPANNLQLYSLNSVVLSAMDLNNTVTHTENSIIENLLAEPTTQHIYLGTANGLALNHGLKNIQLELEPGISVNVTLDNLHIDANGSIIWKGRIVNQNKKSILSGISTNNQFDNQVVLVENNNRLSGDFTINGHSYVISSINDKDMILIKVDKSKYSVELPPIDSSNINKLSTKHNLIELNYTPPKAITYSSPPTSFDPKSEDVSHINVLMVMTKEAVQQIGSEQFKTYVSHASDDLQSSANNSLLPIKYTVTAVDSDISEANMSFGKLLSNLTDSKTPLGKYALEQREMAQADLVTLIAAKTQSCGLAYVNKQVKFGNGFSVVSQSCAIGNHTLAHELGHNLGASHEPGNGVNYNYPYGHGYQYPKAYWRTVMAYQCQLVNCIRLNSFSNPNLKIMDIPKGIEEKNDNTRVLNQTRYSAANIYPKEKNVIYPDYIFPENISSYTAKTVVLQLKNGKQYQCKPLPYGNYCSDSNQYEPGVGSHWPVAWTELQ